MVIHLSSTSHTVTYPFVAFVLLLFWSFFSFLCLCLHAYMDFVFEVVAFCGCGWFGLLFVICICRDLCLPAICLTSTSLSSYNLGHKAAKR